MLLLMRSGIHLKICGRMASSNQNHDTWRVTERYGLFHRSGRPGNKLVFTGNAGRV
jgi:hypothetical protein